MSLPFVTCMMPTYGRPDYVAESLAMFLAQDYPAKELLILNDCPGQKFECDCPNVRVINTGQRYLHLGDKRNEIIEQARGELIAVWDDDDVYLPWRLSFSISEMNRLGTPLYFPAEYWAYWGSETLHVNQASSAWISHPLFVYRRELWRESGRYPPQTAGEDSFLAWNMLKHIGIEWPRYNVARVDRVMVLRGQSRYVHTSIQGGTQPPNTEAGVIKLVPQPISDPPLRNAVDLLILQKRIADEYRVSHPCSGATADCVRTKSYLDELVPDVTTVGYGELGIRGSLGYEDKSVEVCGRRVEHALSSHPPARLRFALDNRYATFTTEVAINDDVGTSATAADFRVIVDGQLAAVVEDVRPHQLPRRISVNVRDSRELELLAHPRKWDSCHAIWVDPVLTHHEDSIESTWVPDALNLAEIEPPDGLCETDLCIATVVSPGFEGWLDDLLGSVVSHSQCTSALIAVFCFGYSREIDRIVNKYQAVMVRCRSKRPINMSCKSVLYSAARVLPARKFLCLDADMIVMDDLRPLVATLDATATTSVLVARDGKWMPDLHEALRDTYYCQTPLEDLEPYFGGDLRAELASQFVINDGLFAASAVALRAIEEVLRSMPRAAVWIDEPNTQCTWRNQFVFNLALVRSRCAVEMNPRYNVQLHQQAVEWDSDSPIHELRTSHGKVAVAHFSGASKGLRESWGDRFRAAALPLSGSGLGSGYDDFVAALRRWLGRVGRDALAWSFYGTTDGLRGSVRDPSTFPLFAALHSLICSNGCERVLETGTARGVSAACLAAAVAHRNNPVVVSIDPVEYPERSWLWAELPTRQRSCIEPRCEDSISGLTGARDRGETYHAILLDTVHTAEHVLQEFDLAVQLVCPGGLILIHDAVYQNGTVAVALDEIQRRGYGVVRLWTAADGIREDDRLGLAVIENRILGPLHSSPLANQNSQPTAVDSA